jgi:hypothetical protein
MERWRRGTRFLGLGESDGAKVATLERWRTMAPEQWRSDSGGVAADGGARWRRGCGWRRWTVARLWMEELVVARLHGGERLRRGSNGEERAARQQLRRTTVAHGLSGSARARVRIRENDSGMRMKREKKKVI